MVISLFYISTFGHAFSLGYMTFSVLADRQTYYSQLHGFGAKEVYYRICRSSAIIYLFFDRWTDLSVRMFIKHPNIVYLETKKPILRHLLLFRYALYKKRYMDALYGY